MAKFIKAKKRVGACGEPTNSKNFSIGLVDCIEVPTDCTKKMFVGKVSVASNKPLNFRG